MGPNGSETSSKKVVNNSLDSFERSTAGNSKGIIISIQLYLAFDWVCFAGLPPTSWSKSTCFRHIARMCESLPMHPNVVKRGPVIDIRGEQ
jgi:hypothetical protein